MNAGAIVTAVPPVRRQHRPHDARGIPLSGASVASVVAYERALAATRTWRLGADAHLDAALGESPRFVMAHVLRAYLLVCSRDPLHYRAAAQFLESAPLLQTDRYEQMHLAAIGAALNDNLPSMRAHLDELIDARPHDLLSLQVSQSIDYMTGDFARMRARVDAVARRVPAGLPGHGTVLAMRAFAMAETGDAPRAEEVARAALEFDPLDARAHHAMAHVFEMNDRPQDGTQWMQAHGDAWAIGTTFTAHGWWHTSLFELARDHGDAALSIYDGQFGGSELPPAALSNLIDAASLLARIALHGYDVGARAAQLALAWDAHIEDSHCSFSDLHAMLAFGLAGDGIRAERLEKALMRAAAQRTRYGDSTRDLGLPGVRALRAYFRGDMTTAVALLAGLPSLVHRLGGSHAQRDVFRLTLMAAANALRKRPQSRRQRRAATLPGLLPQFTEGQITVQLAR